MLLKVGTRGSRLALSQTNRFLEELRIRRPDVEFKVEKIKTLGDTERLKPLFTIDSKGIFEKEIDQAITSCQVDFAVSSLKDVPTLEDPHVTVATIPKRASPCDAFISKNNQPLKSLPGNAVIGTGSLRRLAQIKHFRPDLEVVPIRGNVDTRIRKVKKGEVDGIVVAEAGLQRMGLEKEATQRLPLEQFPSAPGQGALAIIARKEDENTIKVLKSMEDQSTRAEVAAERSLMIQLEGGCRVPIGAVGKVKNSCLSLRGVMFTLDGKNKIESTEESSLKNAEDLGIKVAESLLAQGAKKIELEWRKKYGPW